MKDIFIENKKMNRHNGALFYSIIVVRQVEKVLDFSPAGKSDVIKQDLYDEN